MPDFGAYIGQLNAFDYFVLAVILLSGYRATIRGLMREILALAGWVIAVAAGLLFGSVIAVPAGEILRHEPTSNFIGFLIPFLVAVVVWYFFASIVSSGLANVTSRALDRPLGFVFGVLRGGLLVVILYMVAIFILADERRLPLFISDSQSIAPMRSIARFMTGFAPDNLRDTLESAIIDAENPVLQSGEELLEDEIELVK